MELLEGLEAVALSLSEAYKDNDSLRIDSEFFKKEYLKEDNIRSSYRNALLGDIAFITDGQHGYHEVDEQSKIAHLTAKNTKGWFADKENVDYLAKWVDEKNKRSSLRENDILLSTRGTVGQCSYVTNDVLPANIDQDIVRIHLGQDLITPHFLLAYINSTYGQHWIKRNTSGMVQQGLPIARVKRFPIPVLSNIFQSYIVDIIATAYKKIKESKALYKEAGEKLLSALELTNYIPTSKNISIKSLSKSFGESGRLDSEFYQPKYDQLIEIIKQKSLYYKKIGDFSSYNRRGLQPVYVENGDLQVITSRHILETGLAYDSFAKTDFSNWTLQANARVFNGDILTYTTGANIGRTAIYPSTNKALASNHVNILRVTGEQPEYIAFVMNSIIGRLQTEQLSAGSAQAELYPKDINNFLIPFISKNEQDNIQHLLQNSRQSDADAKQLLSLAKKSVELAINKGEKLAIQMIENSEIVLI